MYGVYVALYSHKSGVKKLTTISSFTFLIACLAILIAGPSFEMLKKDSLTKLRRYQPLYDWDSHAEMGSVTPVEPDFEGEATQAWDVVQKNLRCCGYSFAEDWDAYKPAHLQNENVLPHTCCQDTVESDLVGYCQPYMPRWTKDCSHAVQHAIGELERVMATALAGGFLFAMLGSIILLCLPNESQDNYISPPDTFKIHYPAQQLNLNSHIDDRLPTADNPPRYPTLEPPSYGSL